MFLSFYASKRCFKCKHLLNYYEADGLFFKSLGSPLWRENIKTLWGVCILLKAYVEENIFCWLDNYILWFKTISAYLVKLPTVNLNWFSYTAVFDSVSGFCQFFLAKNLSSLSLYFTNPYSQVVYRCVKPTLFKSLPYAWNWSYVHVVGVKLSSEDYPNPKFMV